MPDLRYHDQYFSQHPACICNVPAVLGCCIGLQRRLHDQCQVTISYEQLQMVKKF